MSGRSSAPNDTPGDGKNYQSIRIFQNPVLEWCTHVHPSIPLLMWTPVVAYWFYQAATVHQLTGLEWALIGPLGLIIWTLTEYLLHRYVFHFPAKTKLGKRFVYLFHGLHHDDPNDPTRLVMPPVPAIIYVILLYGFFGLLLPERYTQAFMGFFIIGYLCYDYIHYATHHFKMNSKVGRYLKRYHLVHHHAHEAAKYGVSSPLWDYIFHTVTGPKERPPWA